MRTDSHCTGFQGWAAVATSTVQEFEFKLFEDAQEFSSIATYVDGHQHEELDYDGMSSIFVAFYRRWFACRGLPLYAFCPGFLAGLQAWQYL